MVWKKLLDNKELIAYEKSTRKARIRIEARFKNQRWRIYKTYNFKKGEERVSHVKEYIATTTEEARQLLTELRKEDELQLKDIRKQKLDLGLRRCYKEDYVEKWKFTIDNFSQDNFVFLRFEEQVKLDIVLHENYNHLERAILEKLIYALGLKDMSNKIRYDFFYFKRHSAKRRVYKEELDREILAQMEFKIDS
jgi:hypothetical protein